VAALGRSHPAKARRRLARYRRLYGRANLIAVSQGVAADLREQLGLAQANIVTIYNPFDLEAIRRQAAAPDPDIPAEPYILYIGRFARQKRHDLLLAAWRAAGLPHRLVLLAHPDAGLTRLVAASSRADRVTIAGFRENPYPWIARADLLVLCSDHEGLPNVLIEALVCGTRVVSTDCPSGPREVLTGELARFLVPCGDTAALAAAMRAALAAPRPQPGPELGPFAAPAVLEAYEALPARWRAPA
jgi:glycosyltransferase involved in cell wall biosynthesis